MWVAVSKSRKSETQLSRKRRAGYADTVAHRTTDPAQVNCPQIKWKKSILLICFDAMRIVVEAEDQ